MNVPTLMVVVASLLTAATLSVVPASVEASTETAHTTFIERERGVFEKTSAPNSGEANVRTSYTQEPNDGTEPAATVRTDTPGITKETQSAPSSRGAASGPGNLIAGHFEHHSID